MHRTNKYLALLLAAGLAVTYGGCGGNESSAREPAVQEQQEENDGETLTESAGQDSEEEESGGDSDEKKNSGELEQDADGFYMISSAEDMLVFREMVEDAIKKTTEEKPHNVPGGVVDAILTEDIDMSSVCSPEAGGWKPIGKNAFTVGEGEDERNVDGYYSGVFNGNGHTISNLYINEANGAAGLFLNIYHGEIQNLTISDSEILGVTENRLSYGGTAAIASYLERDAILRNCVISDTVTVTGTYNVGGLAGYATEGQERETLIEGCENHAVVTGSQRVGGILAVSTENVRVYNCSNYGTVTGTEDYVGGIVGSPAGDSYYHGLIAGCVNYGNVVSENGDSVGGIAGLNGTTIRYCVNAGSVSSTNGDAYDIADNDASMRYCLNIGTVQSPLDPGYAYTTGDDMPGGRNLSPGDPSLTDGSLTAQLNSEAGAEYWVQGEQFPVWSGLVPED